MESAVDAVAKLTEKPSLCVGVSVMPIHLAIQFLLNNRLK
jgi:hypothetical protein